MSRTGYIYDETMCLHQNTFESHPECPERIKGIMSEIKLNALDKLMVHVPSRQATDDELLKAHECNYLQELETIMKMDELSISKESMKYNSLYLNKDSLMAGKLSAGSVINLVNEVVTGKLDNGIAVVRPPGHHAEYDVAMGFCLFNNVAVAAMNIMDRYPDLTRIAIVDWDVHHGNATQHMFYDDNRVLFISLHRYDNGEFYPGKPDAEPSRIGADEGKGKNVNIAWSSSTPYKIGDSEYVYAFDKVVIPVLREFKPQLILVSAGFDCARGDPLGGLSVTPVGFENMTYMLKSLQPDSKIVIVLEGGYNINAISRSMLACTRILLGAKPIPLQVDPTKVNKDALKSVSQTIKEISTYWECFN
jgi:histone deacetylase 6